jgi:hypothetical protein
MNDITTVHSYGFAVWLMAHGVFPRDICLSRERQRCEYLFDANAVAQHQLGYKRASRYLGTTITPAASLNPAQEISVNVDVRD